VLRISENVLQDTSNLFTRKAFTAAAPTPIETGTRTLAVEVHVTYALQ
jgi:uncharacterized protein YggE